MSVKNTNKSMTCTKYLGVIPTLGVSTFSVTIRTKYFNRSCYKQGLYPFSEKNFKDFSRTLIDFSRTPNFTSNPFIAKISKSFLLTVYIHFL